MSVRFEYTVRLSLHDLLEHQINRALLFICNVSSFFFLSYRTSRAEPLLQIGLRPNIHQTFTFKQSSVKSDCQTDSAQIILSVYQLQKQALMCVQFLTQ